MYSSKLKNFVQIKKSGMVRGKLVITGMPTQPDGFQPKKQIVDCPRCSGEKKIDGQNCPRCGGKGMVKV